MNTALINYLSQSDLKTINIMKRLAIVFFCALAYCSCTNVNGKKIQPEKMVAPASSTQTAIIEKGGITTSTKLPAQLAAYEEVSIFPKVNGYVKNVMVDIGSHVNKGQLLMTLEDPELEQAALGAKASYEKAQSDYAINKENYNRLAEAAETPGAVSSMDLALSKSKVTSSNAMLSAAYASWQQQETMLQYLVVRAPFQGVITARNANPGALVSNSQKDMPMLELKQESHLRLQVDVPEDIAAELKLGDPVTFDIPALDNKEMHGHISRISDNVNTQFRSERIELDIYNDNSLKSGMYADVIINAKPNEDVYRVPLDCVYNTSEGKYVKVFDNNKWKKVNVSTYRQSLDSIELKGNLYANERVLVNNSVQN